MELKDIFSEMEKCAQADDKAGFEAHDLSFHNLILTIGGNDRIVEAVNVSRSQMYAKCLSTTPTRPLEGVLEPHRRLFNAVVAGDSAAAATAAQMHLIQTLRILVEQSTTTEQNYVVPFSEWFERIEWMLTEYPAEKI